MSETPENSGHEIPEEERQAQIKSHLGFLKQMYQDSVRNPEAVITEIHKLAALKATENPAIERLLEGLGAKDPGLRDQLKHQLLAKRSPDAKIAAAFYLQTARALKLESDPEMMALMEDTDQWLQPADKSPNSVSHASPEPKADFSDLEPLLHRADDLVMPGPTQPPPAEPTETSSKTRLQAGSRWDDRDLLEPVPEPRPNQISTVTPDTTELKAALEALKNIRHPTLEQIAEIQQLADDLAPPGSNEPISSTTMDDLVRRHEEKSTPAENQTLAEPAEFDPAKIELTYEQELEIRPLFDQLIEARQRLVSQQHGKKGIFELGKLVKEHESRIAEILQFPPNYNPENTKDEESKAWDIIRGTIDIKSNFENNQGGVSYYQGIKKLFSQAPEDLRRVVDQWIEASKHFNQSSSFSHTFEHLLSEAIGMPDGDLILEKAFESAKAARKHYEQLLENDEPDATKLCQALAQTTGADIAYYQTQQRLYRARADYLNEQAQKTNAPVYKNRFGNWQLEPDTDTQTAVSANPAVTNSTNHGREAINPVLAAEVPSDIPGDKLIPGLKKLLKIEVGRPIDINSQTLVGFVRKTIKLPFGVSFKGDPQIVIQDFGSGQQTMMITGTAGIGFGPFGDKIEFGLILNNDASNPGNLILADKEIRTSGRKKKQEPEINELLDNFNTGLRVEMNNLVGPEFEVAGYSLENGKIRFSFRPKQSV